MTSAVFSTMSEILLNAQSKLSASGYEILGSEQLLQSILENSWYDLTTEKDLYQMKTIITI